MEKIKLERLLLPQTHKSTLSCSQMRCCQRFYSLCKGDMWDAPRTPNQQNSRARESISTDSQARGKESASYFTPAFWLWVHFCMQHVPIPKEQTNNEGQILLKTPLPSWSRTVSFTFCLENLRPSLPQLNHVLSQGKPAWTPLNFNVVDLQHLKHYQKAYLG